MGFRVPIAQIAPPGRAPKHASPAISRCYANGEEYDVLRIQAVAENDASHLCCPGGCKFPHVSRRRGAGRQLALHLNPATDWRNKHVAGFVGANQKLVGSDSAGSPMFFSGSRKLHSVTHRAKSAETFPPWFWTPPAPPRPPCPDTRITQGDLIAGAIGPVDRRIVIPGAASLGAALNAIATRIWNYDILAPG